MFGKLRNSIVGKIMAGYALIICLAFVTTLVSMYTAYKNRKIDRLVSEAYYPMVLSLKETEILLSDSYKLTNNWIYQPSVKEKEKLKLLHSTESVRQSGNLLQIAGRFEDDSARVKAATIIDLFGKLMNEEQVVMKKLATDESYSNDVAVDEAITAMDEKITPAFNTLTSQINRSLKEQNQLLDEAKTEKDAASSMLSYLYISNLILFVIIGIYATYMSLNSVTRPIAALSDLILMLSKGKFVSVKLKKSRDEVGRMGEAIENMLTGLKKKIEFAETIGKGNYESQFELLGEDDAMGEALMQMRENLSKAAEEDRKRNWATEGLAKFADILRAKNNGLDELSDNIIRNLVKYMNANQGGLFLINDDNKNDAFLELAGCYAYDRKKYLKSRVEIGQGITGQAVLEKGTIYMTDIPKDYLRITSGLGEALPRNLLIVPLKLDETVFGVVELASFEAIESYKIDFVERLGESIASTISTVRVSERTKQLLGESQQQAEEMRAQEEEMRQNMEELSATQEDMQRVLRDVQGKEQYMTDLINASSDSILTVDRDLKVINCNTVFRKTYSGMGMEIEKGFDLTLLFPTEDEKNRYRQLYKRVFSGEQFEVNDHYQFNGIDAYYVITYSPITSDQGDIIAAAVFVKDVTQVTKAKNEAQHQAEEMKAQEEELRQNMEELSATQDEMHRVLKEVQDNEGYLNEVLNASKDSIFTVDAEFKLISWNSAFAVGVEALGVVMTKGMDILNIFSFDPSKVELQRTHYTRVLNGENFETNESFEINGSLQYYTSTYTPLRRATGEVFGAAIFARDMTQLTNALNEAKRLAEETQQQNEEVKAQEEELRQNMEELSATQEEIHRVLGETQNKERYLNELINVSTDAIFTLDRDFKILDCNQYFANRLKGMGIEVVKGFDIMNLFKGDEKKKHQADYQRALDGEAFEQTNHSVINGHELYLSSSYSPMRDTSGAIVAMACFTKDVTQLMTAQQKAIDQQRYYNDVIEGMSDCVVTIDKDYKIVVANSAFKKIFSGYGLSVEPGASLLAMAKGDKKAEEQFKKPYVRAFAGEHVEEPLRHHFDRDFQVSYNPLRDAQGRVTGVSLIAHDITHRLQLSNQ